MLYVDGPLKTPIQTLSPSFSFNIVILLQENLSWQWFQDLSWLFTTKEVWAYWPRIVRVVQSNTYIPPLPVELLYPSPSFRSTVSNTTRAFSARFLLWSFKRTSKAITRSSKSKVVFIYEPPWTKGISLIQILYLYTCITVLIYQVVFLKKSFFPKHNTEKISFFRVIDIRIIRWGRQNDLKGAEEHIIERGYFIYLFDFILTTKYM